MIQQITRFLRQIESRQLYFWIGFISGVLFWWLFPSCVFYFPDTGTAEKKIWRP